ncbi:MAG: glycosyltransferase [Cyanobacteriota bacterium]|nr:glycosyltransferase [Cyanobacteriota bacterium]
MGAGAIELTGLFGGRDMQANRESGKISIIVPVFDPPTSFLRECLESVLAQTYPHWELCIADDRSTRPEVREILSEYQQRDRRIQVTFRSQNGGICKASNSAIEIATGEFVALLDHDDVLAVDALEEVAKLLAEHPDADFIYSDEDKIDDRGNFQFPFYKPDWCPDTFLSRMYTCHLGVYRRSLVNQIGGFRVGYEGSQDYDLVLRLTERTDRIFHIPKILYHWRMYLGSTSRGVAAKPYAIQAARQALQDALERRGESGIVRAIPGDANHFLIRYSLNTNSLVSIIIILPESGDRLQECLDAIFQRSQYPNYEVILIGNRTQQLEATPILVNWQIREPQRFRYYFASFDASNYQLRNEAVRKAKGEYLLFFDSQLEAFTSDWIEGMLEQAQRPSIAAVSALIIAPTRRVFHAGMNLDFDRIYRYSHHGLRDTVAGYFGYLQTINNVSAVTEKCLMCRRDVFEAVGGFDEQLEVAFGDVDLCLKFRSKGYNNLYLPHVRFTYFSRSKQLENSPWQDARESAAQIVRQRWKYQLQHDPCNNLNLTLTRTRNTQNQESETFIITGMHRSGTSLMASVFDCLGVDLGERFLGADRGNQAGYFEDLDFLNLQRSMLQASCSVGEIGWTDWGWNSQEILEEWQWQNYRDRAKKAIESRQKKQTSWGWKDPRTSLMLNFWHSLLPQAKYVFVYRVPWEVVDSISCLNHPFFQEHADCAIEIWQFYNRRILEFYQKYPDRCILSNVRTFSDSPNRFLDLLQAKFGMEIRDEWRSQIADIFQPQLFHHLDNISQRVRQLQTTSPQYLELLAALDTVADIPSDGVWEREIREREINRAIDVSVSFENSSLLISIVIPCFNHGEFLAEAIQSIEAYPEPIYEIIIVNDGSTDTKTQDTIADLKQRKQCKYIILEQTNQGLAAARNAGIEVARGEYILTLDADNKIRSNYLEKGIEILQQYPKVGVVYGNAGWFGEKRGIFQVPNFDLPRLLLGNYIDACAIFRKQVWQDCGGYDPNIPEKLGYEDWDFWLSAVEAGWEFYHLKEVTFEYRVRRNSMVAACNLPENRQKLFRYVCNKHFNLFLPYLPELLANKEAAVLKETRRANLLASQVGILQSHLTSKITQNLERDSCKPLTISQPPLVSLCIPTYNGDRFLKLALESAFAQTYPHLEIILSDDGSADRTLEIAAEFQARSSDSIDWCEYTIFSHKQLGLAGNWNACLDRARGEYIKFLCQDDLLEPDCVEKMVRLAQQDREIGLVFSSRIFLLEEGVDRLPGLMQLYRGCRQSHLAWSNLQPIQSGSDLLIDPNLMENPINKIGEPSTVLLRKSIFDRVGKFDPDLHQFVDLEMWWRILLHAKVGFVDRHLSYFRIHPHQQTYSHLRAKKFDWDRFYYKIATASIFDRLPEIVKIEAFCRYLLATQNPDDDDCDRLNCLIQTSTELISPLFSSFTDNARRQQKIARLIHKILHQHPDIPITLN